MQKGLCSQKFAVPSQFKLRHGASAGILKLIKIKTRTIYFPHKLRPTGVHITLNGWNIPLMSKIPLCNLREEDYMKAVCRNDGSQGLQKFTRAHSLFKSERLSANIKLSLPKANY
jgi:hypothetical protein